MSSRLKKYKRLKYLGKGSYGAAILVELRSDPSQRFVIKEIVIGHLKPEEQASAKNEADVLHQMNHSNITMYIESFVESEKLYIVMENADGGDLAGAIQARRKDKHWDEEEVMRIFVQIILALKHVHSHNILHRDLKAQNIFLTSKSMVKLGDFGIAKVLDATDDQARTQIGTPYYLSPEICESKPYGRESDVWSLGVLLYELVALQMPFQATSLPALVHNICCVEPDYTAVGERYSPALVALTQSMLAKSPEMRPAISQLVQSDFIKMHISRLLSYTLKVGHGGVGGGYITGHVPLIRKKAEAVGAVEGMDSEEAEQHIESVHSEIRAQELELQSGREARRQAEREKVRNRALGNRSLSPNTRSLSPKGALKDKLTPKIRTLSPKGRALSPKTTPIHNSPTPTPRPAPSPPPTSHMRTPRERAEIDSVQTSTQTSGRTGDNSAASRDFFANRAAAQAVKARAEADRHDVFKVSDHKVSDHSSEAEARIALLKAHRGREKERELSQKETELKVALEQNRDARSSRSHQPAVAFDIDLGGSTERHPRRSSRAEEVVEVGHESARRPQGPQGDERRRNANIAVEIRTGKGEVGLFTHPMFADPALGASDGGAGESGEARDLRGEGGEGSVLRRLQSRRHSQLQARHEAQGIFKALREKRREENKRRPAHRHHEVARGHAPPSSLDLKENDAKSSNCNATNATNGTTATGVDNTTSTSMQTKLEQMMSQVDAAKESVMRAVQTANRRERGHNGESAAPTVTGEQGTEPDGPETETVDLEPAQLNGLLYGDDLEHSLDDWLTQQKRCVTVRRKRVGVSPLARSDSDSLLEAFAGEPSRLSIDLYSETLNESDTLKSVNSAARHTYGAYGGMRDGATESKFDTDNDEVVSLQCMLAQALMAEGDD